MELRHLDKLKSGTFSPLEATADLDLDLMRLEEERPRMARLLTENAGNP